MAPAWAQTRVGNPRHYKCWMRFNQVERLSAPP
jgi:hypothetical protein